MPTDSKAVGPTTVVEESGNGSRKNGQALRTGGILAPLLRADSRQLPSRGSSLRETSKLNDTYEVSFSLTSARSDRAGRPRVSRGRRCTELPAIGPISL